MLPLYGYKNVESPQIMRDGTVRVFAKTPDEDSLTHMCGHGRGQSVEDDNNKLCGARQRAVLVWLSDWAARVAEESVDGAETETFVSLNLNRFARLLSCRR